MRKAKYTAETDGLLAKGGILTVQDFISLCPDLALPSVYSRIRKLVQDGRLFIIGKGRYSVLPRLQYSVEITPQMRELHAVMLAECVGIDNCISQKGKNLLVEVPRGHVSSVVAMLSRLGYKAVSRQAFDSLPAPQEGFIIVGPLVSDAPLSAVEQVPVPSLEKTLVDALCDKSAGKGAVEQSFQRAFDVYPINRNRLGRYAARRGVSEELSVCLAQIKPERVSMFSAVQRYFSSLPVSKVWVFGSFARCEETDASDLDLLVSYEKDAKISLLTVIRWRLDLEKIAGRTVDLVEDGYLKPFAVNSAERDKYLLYERKN